MVAKGWNIDVDTSAPVTNPQVLLVGIYYWNLAPAPLKVQNHEFQFFLRFILGNLVNTWIQISLAICFSTLIFY